MKATIFSLGGILVTLIFSVTKETFAETCLYFITNLCLTDPDDASNDINDGSGNVALISSNLDCDCNEMDLSISNSEGKCMH